MNDNEKSIIAQELGKRGGNKTKEKYGEDHYKRISQKAAQARKENKIKREYVKKQDMLQKGLSGTGME